MIGAVVLVCAVVGAAPMGRWVEVEPALALGQLRDAYWGGATTDEVVVAISSEGEHQGDRLLVRAMPPDKLRIQTGPLDVLLDGDVLRVTHRANRAVYFETRDEVVGGLELLRRELPPLPIPQVSLALGEDPLNGALTPYAAGVRWKSAQMYPDSLPPVTVVKGESARASVVVEIDAQSGRLRTMTTEIDGGSTTIKLSCTALDVPGAEVFAFDAQGRLAGARLSDLNASGADVRVGDKLPDMELLTWPEPYEQAVLTGPAAIVFFTSYRDPALALVAVAGGAASGVRVLPVLALETFDPKPDLALSMVRDRFNASGMWFTRHPDETLRRFALPPDREMGLALLVAWDAAGVVRLIEPLRAEAEPTEVSALLKESLGAR